MADNESAEHGPDEAAEIEELHRRIQALGSDVQRVNNQLHTLLRQRPLVALGAALAAGYLLGRVGRAIQRL
jgi:hypothetical protein